ncbi:MAG: hypothetical protein PCFJNLEI_04067 [Verrucomicrobiae bacterium]|nr:hypothetical protein [Verrucomicrobiae bacterium]
MFRKTIFWTHLIAGVVAGVVVLIMAATGVLLAFERQITGWADGTMHCEPVGERMSLEKLLAAHAKATGVIVRADPTAPVTVNLGREQIAFVDPYTGNVLGEGSKKVRSVFHVVTDVHRWLGVHGENRAIARAVTGASNVAFLFLVVSGAYIWWQGGVKWFRAGLRGKARDWNWHNVVGLWSAVPLFLIVLAGVLISYPSLTGTASAPRRPGGPVFADGLDKLWPRAAQQMPGWRTITVRLPNTFLIDAGNGARPDLRGQLTLDPATGEVVKWETLTSQPVGRQVRAWARFIHTGEVAGPVGQVVALLASAGAVVLVWTGLALSWRRFWTWRRGNLPVVPVSKEKVHASCT